MAHRADGEVKRITEADMERRLREEDDMPMRFWFLSFAGGAEGWRGLIIEAPGFAHAYYYASVAGLLIKDSEVQGILIPPREVPPKEHHNRLLKKEEFYSFWGAMKTFDEWEAEQQKG
jgi:hypothetical protein